MLFIEAAISVRAEPVEACPEFDGGPFDKLRANGSSEQFSG
jgi:hypothetical protein